MRRNNKEENEEEREGGEQGVKWLSAAIISAANTSNHAQGIAKVVAVMAAYPADVDVQEEACVALSILARRSAEYEEVSAWMCFLARRQPRVLGGECGGHSSG